MQAALTAEAQRMVAEGELAFKELRYTEAARKFELALSDQYRRYLSADDVRNAESKLADARNRLSSTLGGGTIGQTVTQQMELQRQRTSAEVANDLQQGRAALASGNFEGARQFAANAQVKINNARDVFSQGEVDKFNADVTQLSKDIGAGADRQATQSADEREKALADEAVKRRAQVAGDKAKRIETILRSARAKQLEQRYEDALQDVEQALMLDPNNPTALLARDILNHTITIKIDEDYRQLRDQKMMRLQAESRQATVPNTKMMEFPRNWERKTQERLGIIGVGETPENRKTLAALETNMIPANFAANQLGDVLGYIATTGRVEVDVNWESLRAVGVDRSTPVTLQLGDNKARVVLERVLAQVSRDARSKADWSVSDGIVNIASADAINRQTTTLVYNITDLLLTVPNFTDVPRVDLEQIYAGKDTRTLASSPFKRDDREGIRPPTRKEKIGEMIALLQKTVDPDSWRDHGGDVGSVQELNGSLIVTTTPRNHAQITGLLAKLREIRSMQINVEARFLTVASDFFEQLGFNLNLVFNTKSSSFTFLQAIDPTARPSDLTGPITGGGDPFIRTFRTPAGQSIVPVTIPPGAPVIGVTPIPMGPNNPLTGPNDSSARLSTIPVQNGGLNLAQTLFPGGSFGSSVLNSTPALGIAGQFLDDVQVDFLVKATQADRRSTIVNAPKVTFTNGQTSNFYVITQQVLVTDLTPVTGDGSVGFDPTTSAIPSGVTLLVEGVITADRRYVTLNIDTSVNTIVSIQALTITAAVGGALVNSGTVGSTIQLPTVSTTRVQTTSTIPDEGTLLLGGQRVITEREVEVGVPVLSKIPVLNRFFTNRIETKEESTLMVLVKPTIILQGEEEERAFPGITDVIRAGN